MQALTLGKQWAPLLRSPWSPQPLGPTALLAVPPPSGLPSFGLLFLDPSVPAQHPNCCWAPPALEALSFA